MKPNNGIASQSAVTAWEHAKSGSVTSKDGTTIGYRQLGQGPGIVLIHGAMESARSHRQLAEALADTFTVYLPDRRGRGRSGPPGEDYSILKEVEDLDALLTAADSHDVFGVSSGALIALQAALTLPAIQKVAIYEPPLIVNDSISTDFLPRYERETAEGKVAAALVTGMKGAQMGPPIFNFVPRWLLEMLTRMMLANEDKKATGDTVTFRVLAPTLRCDFQMVVEMREKLESFRDLPTEALLLGGSKSPPYLKTAVAALEKVLPHARRIEFPGLGHGGSGNTDQGGQPGRVAQELRRFFA